MPTAQPAEAPKLLVDQREAARLLSVCPMTIYRLAKTGQIPSVRVGRITRYSPADLAEWAAKNSRYHGRQDAEPSFQTPA